MTGRIPHGTLIRPQPLRKWRASVLRSPKDKVIALIVRVRHHTHRLRFRRVAAHQNNIQRVVLPVPAGIPTAKVKVQPAIDQLQRRFPGQQHLRFVLAQKTGGTAGHAVAGPLQVVAHVEGERFTNVRFDVVHQVRVKRCEVEGDVVQRFLDEAVFAVEDLEVREILVSLLKDLMVFVGRGMGKCEF